MSGAGGSRTSWSRPTGVLLVACLLLGFVASPVWAGGFDVGGENFALITQAGDEPAALEVKAWIESQGGRVAIIFPPHLLAAWIPAASDATVAALPGVTGIHRRPLDASRLPWRDTVTQAGVAWFNAVTGGQAAASLSVPAVKGLPLVGDTREAPPVDYPAFLRNLPQGVEASTGNSDTMSGTVAVALFLLESDGTIDANTYSWSVADAGNTITRATTGLAWWSSRAASQGLDLTFTIYPYQPTDPACQQGYEPIKHSSNDDSLWIGEVMSNLGYNSGGYYSRVLAFNTAFRSAHGTDWAYSVFVGYNPTGASSTFTDGYFAYAYIGGPYTQLLFNNDGWGAGNFGLVLRHETGHIFYSCDEYYQAGYGGCTSCGVCYLSGPRPTVLNANCEKCNAASVPCIMRSNEDAICDYTRAQIGWPLSSTADVTVDTSPTGLQISVDSVTYTAPHTFSWDASSSHTIAVASPQGQSGGSRKVFASWSDGGAQSHTISAVTKTITATFGDQYALTTGADPTEGGTVDPAGTTWYNSGATATITAHPNSGWGLSGWSVISGNGNPLLQLMYGPQNVTARFALLVDCTVASSPTGRQVTVDGASRSTPAVFHWLPGSTHTLAVPSPQAGAADTRYLYASWSDGGAQTHTITVGGAATYTATLTTEYSLTTVASPVGGGTVSPSGTTWHQSGEVVGLQATATPPYYFSSWSGGLSGSVNSTTITMSGPRAVVATFAADWFSTVTTSPSGLAVLVDGVSSTTPHDFAWVVGSVHSIEAAAYQHELTESRLHLAGWSDGGAWRHNVTAQAAMVSYTATYVTEYPLAVIIDPPGSGHTSSPATTWYESGHLVNLQATGDGYYSFWNWTGDLTGAQNPAPLTMDGAHAVTAHFFLPLYALAIAGAATVEEKSGAQYTCSAQWEDGSFPDVTALAGWESDNPTALIDAGGWLTTGAVTADESCRLTASLTDHGITRTATRDLTVLNVNHAPTLDPLGTLQVTLGENLAVDLTAGDSDGDGLTFMVENAPPGSSFDPATGHFVWTPAADDIGAWTGVVFTVTDDGLPPLSASQTVTIEVIPPPLFNDIFEGGGTTDPLWKQISGVWKLNGSGQYFSSLAVNNLAVARTEGRPSPLALTAGRIETRLRLSNLTATPNAKVLFAFRDASHYRYVKLVPGYLVIGQVGDYGLAKAGVKKRISVPVAVGDWYDLRVDLYPGGKVTVSAGDAWSPVNQKFRKAVSGHVGLGARRTRSFADTFTVLDSRVLQTR